MDPLVMVNVHIMQMTDVPRRIVLINELLKGIKS